MLILMVYSSVKAEETLAQKLAGRIVLQVESHGEAWYINPNDYKKYYLGKPDDAFALMKKLGIGITDQDITKIPVKLADDQAYSDKGTECSPDINDSDGDCLSDRLEEALGTNPKNHDSDEDGYDDRTEVETGYDPVETKKKLPLDIAFAKNNSGKIFLQVQNKGEAWYVNPNDFKRYYLGTPLDAWNVMKKLGLGIKNSLLKEIVSDTLTVVSNNQTLPQNPVPITPPADSSGQAKSANSALSQAAAAIRAGDTNEALAFFSPEIKNRVKYSLNLFNSESLLAFTNLLSGATETGGSSTEKI